MAKFCPQCGLIILDRSIPACPQCGARLPWALADTISRPPAPPEPAEPALPAEPARPAEPRVPVQLPGPARAPVRTPPALTPGPDGLPEPDGPFSPPPYIPPARPGQVPAHHHPKPVTEGGNTGAKWIGICCGGIILLIFVTAFFALISEDVFSDSGSEWDVTESPAYDTPETPDARTEIAAAIGQPASGDNARATVYSAQKVQAYTWTTSSSDYSYTEEAETGTSWLIVDVEVENTGSAPLSPSTWDFSLSDGAGNLYEPGVYYGNESFGYQEELSRNQKTRGKLLFGIPRDAQDLKLSYDFGTPYGGTQVATWSIG